MQYVLAGSGDDSNVTVFVPGQPPQVAHSDHPNFERIREGVLAGDESVIDLFDVATAAATKFERLTERITTANGRLYLDSEEVDNALATQVVRFLSEGVEDWKPLVKFFENVQSNPNEHSREQLYTWLSNEDFTITDDGLIVGYKGVKKDIDGKLWSIWEGTAIVDGEVHNGPIPNHLGAVVEMPRGDVTHDPSRGCHQGLHVGTFEYANNYASGATLEVHVNPRDVVSVPTDSNWAKMRVCRYVVVDTADQAYASPVVYNVDDDEFEGDGEDFSYVGTDGPVNDWDNEGGTVQADDEQPKWPDIYKKFHTELADDALVHEGDIFEDTDKRRQGRTFRVDTIEGDYAIGKSLPNNVTRKVHLDRLLSRKYRLI